MDKVSVIIPTFNRQLTLLTAVKSVLLQSYPVAEIIICDDGSTDDSRKIIMGINDPRITWLDCGRNGRPSIPRNKGIQKATGDWIAFLDSDDEWLPTKTERQLNLLKENNKWASSSNAYRITDNSNAQIYLSHTEKFISFLGLLKVNTIICSSVIIHSKLLRTVSCFPEDEKYKAIEDYALWLRIAAQEDFVFMNEPLLNYSDNPSSSIRTNYNNVWELRKVVLTGLFEWIRDKDIKLSKEERRMLDYYLTEAIHMGKIPLWQKVRKKLKI